MNPRRDRIAAAPISWGVCEVPGWGHQMAPERVFAEMSQLGFGATEAGPEGFLPREPEQARELLARHGLELVGGFIPAVVHVDGHDRGLEAVERSARWLLAAGAEIGVLAADTAEQGYDTRPQLDPDAWSTLIRNLDRAVERCGDLGLRLALHPHVGTVVETSEDVDRILDRSAVPVCLDTGHLTIGGVDPVLLAEHASERIVHVQMKDVDVELAAQVRAGPISYTEAVEREMYRPLGRGDVGVAAVVRHLEGAGYDGWYVLEQDVTLDAEPPPHRGPIDDVRTSLDLLRGLGVGPG